MCQLRGVFQHTVGTLVGKLDGRTGKHGVYKIKFNGRLLPHND